MSEIGKDVFDGCYILPDVEYPAHLTSDPEFEEDTDFLIKNGVLLKYLGADYLDDDGENIHIPDGVKTIAKCAFDGCLLSLHVSVPDSVTEIHKMAFYDCLGLTIEVPKTVTKIGSDAFDARDWVTLKVKKNSYAHKYAEKNDIDSTWYESLINLMK